MTQQPAPARRLVTVAPERLQRWLAGFRSRHGGDVSVRAEPTCVALSAPDGAVAECAVPFPPLTIAPDASDAGLTAHALSARLVGVLLVRRGGFAAGVFAGSTLVSSKVGSRHVQGRSAAGGQSQQRFARRREGQARVAMDAAADVAARILLPELAALDAVVLGGDRRAAGAVLDDRRLQPLRALVREPFLPVPDPRQSVLLATPAAFRAVRIELLDPEGDDAPIGAPHS